MAKTTLRSMIDSNPPLAGIRGAVAKASPLAQHVSEHIQDPVGATKEGFSNLQTKNLEYEQAKDEMRRQLAPVQSVIDHVNQTHGLDQNQNGIPDDEEMGYQDPNNPNPMMGKPGMNPNMPPNMQQKPGMMQQNNPAMNKNVPGTGPKLYPGRSPAPGSMVRPQNMGTAQPGMQNPAGTPSQPVNPKAPAGPKKVAQKKPGAKASPSIKVHVQGARTKMDAAIANSSISSCSTKMSAGGPGSGRHAEGGFSRHDALGSQGWKNQGNGRFTHSDHSGHSIQLTQNGWRHFVGSGHTSATGTDGESLARHLTSFHGK